MTERSTTTDGFREDPALRDRPTAELIRDLSQQTGDLIRHEFELAKVEMSDKGKSYGMAAGMFGGAGAATLLALGSLTACAIAALATGMATWLAALIVTAVWAAVAGALALSGKSEAEHASPAIPEQTIETVKEDVTWAKTQTRSAGR
jgi:hypothetical protein